MTNPSIAISGLEVSFPTANGTVRAVRGVDLEVARGETLGVVGESGSGKSVTFLAALGLLPRSAMVSGSALVGDTELVGADRATLRSVRGKRVAMIFQDPLSALNPVQRIGHQIVEMIRSHQPMDKRAAHERAIDLLDQVGIPQARDRARQYPHEFSGGMRQRVMIAMAIANDPEVLIADEPTTALDVTVQAQILELLGSLQRDRGMSMVMITHDLGVVARVADRVQVMYAGRVVERGDAMDVFASASHPYSHGLLASLPRPGLDRLEPIVGSPPNMLRPPPGCAFAPRCPAAAPTCLEVVPELVDAGRTEAACVRLDEIARSSR
jgi:peptide/nickel transport system ATP-binding protein